MPDAPRLNAEHRLALIEGQAHFGLHAYDAAAVAFERATVLAEEQHADAPASPARGWLGRALLRARDDTRAESVLKAALAETPERGPVLCALHEAALRRGDLDQAAAYGRRALSEAQDRDSHGDEAEARAAIALEHVVRGRLAEASEQLELAREGVDEIGRPALLGRILALSIEVDLARGRFGQALYGLEILLELATKYPLATRQPEAVVLLAEAMRRTGLAEDARAAALQALAFAKTEGGRADGVRVQAARVLCDVGHYAEAEDALFGEVDVDDGSLDDPAGHRLGVTARVCAHSEDPGARVRAADLVGELLARPAPSVAIRAAQIQLDAARALLVLGDGSQAKAAAKRGLKLVHGLAARGIRLDLMLALHDVQPDERVAEAVLKVAGRILESLPEHAREAFRQRPGLQEILIARD